MVELHYKCGAVLFVASVTGCVLPFQRTFDVTPIRPLSTGIIFAVALCHLLPDAGQILDTLAVTQWIRDVTSVPGQLGDDTDGLYETLPVAETLMCLGIFMMLVIDQCIPCPHHQVQKDLERNNNDKNNDTNTTRQWNEEKSRLLPVSSSSNGGSSSIRTNGGGGDGGSCHGQHAHTHTQHDYTSITTLPSSPTRIPNAKVYATEMAIAIHSIIIGFTMGVDPNTDGLIGFTIAMLFHQLFEGVALAMIARQGNLTGNALLLMVLMFALSLPTGIWIGKGVFEYVVLQHNTDDNNNNNPVDDGSSYNNSNDIVRLDIGTIICQGVPNAIAAGMLIHIGFELMLEDFNHDTAKFPACKLLLVFVGGLTMCFLTFWA